ncbi:hypothetical protein QKW52_17550 [Bacillus sonorensis]|nr:hypothetical protein [Bacillus sonorensis]
MSSLSIAGEKQMTSQLGQILIDHDFEAWGGKELSFSLDSGLSPTFKEAAELSAKAILGAEVTEKTSPISKRKLMESNRKATLKR